MPPLISVASRPASPPKDGSVRSSDEENTCFGEGSFRDGRNPAGQTKTQDHQSPRASSQNREQASRLDDDLTMLRAEQVVDAANQQETANASHSRSLGRNRPPRSDSTDDFDIATKKGAVYQPPENPTTSLAKIFKRVHNSSLLVRYFFYIVPLVLVFLIPLLLGKLLFKDATVGGVELYWFSIWLEIVWLSLWAARIIAKCIPYPMGLVSSLFTNNSKKWRDMGKQLEVPASIFFWWLAVMVSFLPTMTNHHRNGDPTTRNWERVTNKVFIALLVAAALNFAEKIIIQLIAISFHLRTYADRIDINKFQIGSLTKLYKYSREKIQMDDSDFEERETGPGSGTQTPMQYLNRAHKGAREAFSKVGDVAGKVAEDFTGRKVVQSTHPHQVILMLLGTTGGSQVLARRLYRTFAREDSETVVQEDLRCAFDNDEEADAAFQMFDKDLNGDISMEELEAVCVEIGRERKAITASLKDLDSVVSKLDSVLLFIVFIITLIVFLTLISTSTAGVLTSAGSTVLALSWLLSATAQEFLQSIIFVFVKHPFDISDRVSIYGNTGAQGKGDDYFVKKISLLYTEFKKMEGQVVQAPNSYLNTLFILNMRRSGPLAEAVPVIVKFGTTLEQIDSLRQRLLDFVRGEKREYQGKILTELRKVDEVHAVTLNVVFFYKSNWQNELLRLQRRNKFICALMVSMQELGIEGPRMRYPGQKETQPFYLNAPPASSMVAPTPDARGSGPAGTSLYSDNRLDPAQPDTVVDALPVVGYPTSSGTRGRAESATTMSKRVDFSLGMRSMASGDQMAEFYDERAPPRVPRLTSSAATSATSPTRLPRTSHDSGTSAAQATARDNAADPHNGRQSLESQQAARQRLGILHGGTTQRNRFFGRSKKGAEASGGGGDDLESGVVMADIPEGNPHTGRAGDDEKSRG